MSNVDLLARKCKMCGADIVFLHGSRLHCDDCQPQRYRSGARDERTKERRAEDAILTQRAIDSWLRIYNRSRAFSTFGKNDPLDKLPTVQVVRVKDKGYHPMPIDVHLDPLPHKHVDALTIHVEGEYQASQTKSLHATDMPRKHTSFCATCVDMVVDDIASVRVNKGVYLPIEHQCNSMRVYDLRGNLLETKPI